MGYSRQGCVVAVVLAILAAEAGLANAQQQAQPPSGYRRLTPGVETTIPPKPDPEETVSYHNLPEILIGVPNLDWTPFSEPPSRTLKAMATDHGVHRGVWNLEFTFKPMRVVFVDVPAEGGKMHRKPIWYLVYRVRNLGGHLKPVQGPDGKWSTQEVDYPVYFFPQFVLESQELKKAYLDQLIPVAMDPIRLREDPARRLLNSVEISSRPIPVSREGEDHSVWGVAMWEDVDPAIDFFSLYVGGLSNAYQWVDPPGAYKPGDPPATGRRIFRKTLQLNFWRPGDEFDPSDLEVFYFGIPNKVDHQWVFR